MFLNEQFSTDQVMMARAAKIRGLPIDVVHLESSRSKAWLKISIHDSDFCFAAGAMYHLDITSESEPKLGLHVNHLPTLLIADKFKTKQFLKSNGFNVPEGVFIRRRNIERDKEKFSNLSFPLCVKPNTGSEGRGVQTNLTSDYMILEALNRVAKRYKNMILEESVVGEHFRFFYVAPKVVGIRQGIPMNVIGDGKHTIKELILIKNTLRAERDLPTQPQLVIDDDVNLFLKNAGISIDDVPNIGERLFLKGVSNGTAGADTILIDLDKVHPSYLELVEKVCKTIGGLNYTGIDIIIEDISKPANENNYWFLEVNRSPAITGFYFPWSGEKVDIAGYILDMMINKFK